MCLPHTINKKANRHLALLYYFQTTHSTLATMKLILILVALLGVNLSLSQPVIRDCALYAAVNITGLPCPTGTSVYPETSDCVYDCPVGGTREGYCSCRIIDQFTECSDAKPAINGWCPPDYPILVNGGLICAKPCSRGQRLDVCICVDTPIVNNCDLYGPAIRRCPSTTQLWDGRCYSNICPLHTIRVGPCDCFVY